MSNAAAAELHVQASASGGGSAKRAPTCTVELDVADALGVAHSMRTLVRGRKLPPGTADVYERVAAEMIRAAHRELPGARR